MGKRIRVNFAPLIGQLEQRRGVPYTIEAIARGIGVSRPTIKSWLDSTVTRVDLLTLEKALDWLEAQGLQVELQDLLTREGRGEG